MNPRASIIRIQRREILVRLHGCKGTQAGPLRMGRSEINEEEERFQPGPQGEQRFRVKIEPDVFTKGRSGGDREDSC